jgi:hypothetical protein
VIRLGRRAHSPISAFCALPHRMHRRSPSADFAAPRRRGG